MSRVQRRATRVAVMVGGWLVLIGLALSQAQAAVEPEPAPLAKKAPTATAEQIAGWVSQLTSRDFQVRRGASRQLVSAGQAAIGPVAKAADGGDLERTTRCIHVLRLLQASGDKTTKNGAEAALRRLSESKNTTVARRAQAALPKPDPKPGRGAVGRQFGGVQIGNATRVSVRVVNGQRTIEVTEPNHKLLITDVNGKDIRVKITTKVNGKAETREVKAETAEALKKVDPEAYKLYQQHAVKNGLRIRLRAFPPGFPNGRFRAVPLKPGRRARPLPRLSPWHKQVESAQEKLNEAVAQLQKLAGQPQTKGEELREVLKQLVDAQKTLSGLLGTNGKPAPRARPARPAQKPKPKVIKTRGA